MLLLRLTTPGTQQQGCAANTVLVRKASLMASHDPLVTPHTRPTCGTARSVWKHDLEMSADSKTRTLHGCQLYACCTASRTDAINTP